MSEANNLTPEKAYALLQEWYIDKGKLSELKEVEGFTRRRLVAFYFPSPEEGTNRLDLGQGYDLKLNHSYDYKVDEAAVDQVTQAEIKKHKLPWDDLFVYKPTLNKKVYNDLTSEQQKFVQALLDIKPASPQLDIVPTADRAGQERHQQAAIDQSNPQIMIALEPEKAEPGMFYFDGENWWQLDDEIEWQGVEATPDLQIAWDMAQAPQRPSKPRGRAAKKAAKAGA